MSYRGNRFEDCHPVADTWFLAGGVHYKITSVTWSGSEVVSVQFKDKERGYYEINYDTWREKCENGVILYAIPEQVEKHR